VCALVLGASIARSSAAAPSEVQFRTFTIGSAPEGSRDAMIRLKQSAGLVPDLAGSMSGSLILIDSFVTVREIGQHGTLDAKEPELLGLSSAVENRCEWGAAFHSFVALKLGVDRATVDTIRASRPLADPRVRALDRFARQLIEHRGAAAGPDLGSFIQAGFTKEQALEVVAALALPDVELRWDLRTSRTRQVPGRSEVDCNRADAIVGWDRLLDGDRRVLVTAGRRYPHWRCST
jgi:AhpD family alkylhydroperoxidase